MTELPMYGLWPLFFIPAKVVTGCAWVPASAGMKVGSKRDCRPTRLFRLEPFGPSLGARCAQDGTAQRPHRSDLDETADPIAQLKRVIGGLVNLFRVIGWSCSQASSKYRAATSA